MSAGWSERRNQKHAESEARHLVGEARRILKRKRASIPEAVVLDVEASITDVEGALQGGQAEELYELLGAAHAATRPASEHERDRCPPLPYVGPSP